MKISSLAFQYKINQNPIDKKHMPAALTCQSKDTVSFGALKKSQFNGLDYAVVEKFKAPIEKFNTNDDFQNWCYDKIKSDILTRDFGGRKLDTISQRNAIFYEWLQYLFKEENPYNNAAKLLILKAISKNIKCNNDKIPPVLNKIVLKNCLSDLEKNIETDKKYLFDLNKIYETKLKEYYLKFTDTGETGKKWIIIPSKKHSPENFESNVEKAKALSNNYWCTKSGFTAKYLSEGDFHIYLENNNPKLAIRFTGDKIAEIQGTTNNYLIPLEYLDLIQNYIRRNNLKLSSKAKLEISATKRFEKDLRKIKEKLAEAIKNNDTEKIYQYFGFNPQTDESGYFTLSHYNSLLNNNEFTYKDLGIDENKLFEKVKVIKANANFTNSDLNSFKNLEYIGGKAIFSHTQKINLGKLAYIGNGIDIKDSVLTQEDFKNIVIEAHKSPFKVIFNKIANRLNF